VLGVAKPDEAANADGVAKPDEAANADGVAKPDEAVNVPVETMAANADEAAVIYYNQS